MLPWRQYLPFRDECREWWDVVRKRLNTDDVKGGVSCSQYKRW